MNTEFESLFKPMKIGKMEVKNRIVMTAMGIHSHRLVNEDGSYSLDGANYFIERAKGGVGLIVTGAMQVQDWFERVPGSAHNINKVADTYIKNSKYLVDNIHSYGTKIVVQLTAGSGRTAPQWLCEGDAIAPSDDLPNVWNPAIRHRALTIPEIQHYIECFANGAAIAKEAGFDGVEIHAVHEGYLLDQFTMSCTNKRTDKYGGSLENRLRFPCEIVQAIKAKCGNDFPVMVRYSVRSYMKGFNKGALPGEEFEEFGRDLEESTKVAKILEEAGYDALDADNGTYDSWYWSHPPVYMPKACNLKDVKYIKKFVNIPVICAGRMDDPYTAADAVASGEIDAVGLARPLLADPEWPAKVQRGDIEDIRPCIACHNGCLARIFEGKDMCCAVNPAVCREKAYELKPTKEKKNVVVIGGGIGGMEAARVSALRGHNVSLYEKSGELGGVFIAAAAPDFKESDKELIKWYKLQLNKLGVKIHLNTEVTPGLVTSLHPDEIFVATGSKAKKLPVPGIEGKNVVTAIDALLKKKTIGNKVVVVGGGLTGCEIAYDLAKDGKQVTIIEVLDDILKVKGLCAANANILRELLAYYNVEVLVNTSLSAVTEGSVTVKTADGLKNIEADTVITAVGYNSDNRLYEQIKDCGVPVHLIGDAKQVSNLMGAIWDAYEVAMTI